MHLELTTTHQPATDLGFLLHKHPERAQSFSLSMGTAHVFYPHASVDRCTAVLMLEIDPIALSRNKGIGRASMPLRPYVNDRPYVASSFLSVAISRVFGTALSGNCAQRPELANTPIPLEVRIPVLPCRGGEGVPRQLFEPLGYEVKATRIALDEAFPDWGDSPYFDITLSHTTTLRALLSHIYVLIPVLDDDKHYFISEDEVAKLMRHGEGWLPEHPARDLITKRYLDRHAHLIRDAVDRFEEQSSSEENHAASLADREEEELERPVSLHQRRLNHVVDALRAHGARRILDLGCGEGKLIRLLLEDPRVTEVVGVDVSLSALQRAERKLERGRGRERVRLLHGALTYHDARLTGYDAAALVEVVEHLEPERLEALERAVFGFARPGLLIVTTPNAEYNALFPTLPEGRFRHRDHRFEWTREEFRAWAELAASRHGYTTRFEDIGDVDPHYGAPTQACVFVLEEVST
ncbi:MAG: 3' terminal RNA ribose 2'-O-methyltransferase Hen1 [Myxococcota bacterium]